MTGVTVSVLLCEIKRKRKLTSSYLAGLTLHSALEQRLDQGIIAIVPLAGEISAPTRWKCVVLDDTKRDDIIYQPYEPQGNDPEIIRLRVSNSYVSHL